MSATSKGGVNEVLDRQDENDKQWMSEISTILTNYEKQKEHAIKDVEIYLKGKCVSSNVTHKENPQQIVGDADKEHIHSILSSQSNSDKDIMDIWSRFKGDIVDDRIPQMIHDKRLKGEDPFRKNSMQEEHIQLTSSKEDDINKELQKRIADLEKRLNKCEHENKTLVETKGKLKTELEEKVKQAKTQVAKNNQLDKDLQKLKKCHNELHGQCKNLQHEYGQSHQMNGRLSENNKELRNQVQSLKEEKNNLLTRLSAIAGAKLNDNNPNITDLSDQNRPQKLADKYSELYDNEWTDVYESLTEKNVLEESAINQLLNTLQNCFEFCQKHTKLQYEELLSKATTMAGIDDKKTKTTETNKKEDPLIQTITQKVVELQKNCAYCMIPLAQEEYKRLPSERSLCHKKDPTVSSYVDKAIEVSWIAGIQSPPLHIEFDIEPYSEFDTNIMKAFTKTGKYITYLVWPSLHLHKNGGALLSKGVVQCTNDQKPPADRKKEEQKVICKEKAERPRLESSSEDKDGNTSSECKDTKKTNVKNQENTNKKRPAPLPENKDENTNNIGKSTIKANDKTVNRTETPKGRHGLPGNFEREEETYL